MDGCNIYGIMNGVRKKDEGKPQDQVLKHTLGKWSQGSIDQSGLSAWRCRVIGAAMHATNQL
jgi:hypothetical protein